MSVDPEKSARFAVNVRIPGWTGDDVTPGSLYRFADPATGGVTLTVNGTSVELKPERGFARIERRWDTGDTIELTLPMPVRRVTADPRVKDDDGRVALERGPLVYCAEWVDNGGRALNLVAPDGARFTTEFRSDLFNGIEVINGQIEALTAAQSGG